MSPKPWKNPIKIRPVPGGGSKPFSRRLPGSRRRVAVPERSAKSSGSASRRSTIGCAALRRRRVKQPLDPAEVIREAIGQEEAIYEEFMAAWHRSQDDKQTERVEDSGPADDASAWKKKASVCSETRSGNATFLTKAIDTQRAIRDLKLRLAQLQGTAAAAPSSGPAPLADLSDEDLERLTLDDLNCMDNDQLYAIEVRMRDKHGPCRLPLVSNEELRKMSPSQLREHEALCRAEIEHCATPPSRRRPEPFRHAATKNPSTHHQPSTNRTRPMIDVSLQSAFIRTQSQAAGLSLLAFTQYTMPDYEANWHHAELAKRLDRVAAGECRRLMIGRRLRFKADSPGCRLLVDQRGTYFKNLARVLVN